MIIDAHNHPDWHGHDLSAFLANMDAYGIDQTWLLSWECPEDEYDPSSSWAFGARLLAEGGPIPFARCVSYKERAPERFILGYAPDPRRPDAVDRLLAAKRVYGAQVCGEVKLRMMLDNPDAIRLFRVCGKEGMPVTVHLDNEYVNPSRYPRASWWYGGGIGALERALKACPDTVFLGHAPGFWGYISGDAKVEKEPYPTGPVVPGGEVIRLMDACPNLYCDISAGSGYTALSRDPEHAKSFLTKYQDRVLYARDYFDNRHQEFLRSLNLPEDALSKILGGNAERLLASGR